MFVNERRMLGELLAYPVSGKPESYFQVPPHQRKYEWEKEGEVLRLIEDFWGNLESQYFMGPVIFWPVNETSDPYLQIVDGQQRLVTFVIFIRAFVDYVQKRIDENAFSGDFLFSARQQLYEARRLIIKGEKGVTKEKPVIRLSRAINEFFRDKIILNDDTNKIEQMEQKVKGELPAEKNLREAYVKIFRTLEEECNPLEDKKLLLKLIEISTALKANQLFLSITVNNEIDAYTIFETINERGRRLNVNGLLRNLCFRKIEALDQDERDALEREWDYVETQLSNFGAFLWHLWVSREATCPKNQIFRNVAKYIEKMPNEDAVWDFIWDVFFEEAKWYHVYENPLEKSESEDDISRERKGYFEMLKTMGATRCYPLLLGIDYSLKIQDAITPEEANELVKMITCLTFWHSGICGKDARHLEAVYHQLAQQIRKTEKTKDKEAKELVITDIKEKLRKEFPSEDECKVVFKEKRFTNDSFAKMVLRNIEEKKDTESEKTLKADKVVWLEHVLPQTPGKDSPWLTIFPDVKERIEYSTKLGNYTILFDKLNREASNQPFPQKKEKYKQSHIELTKALANEYDEWDKEAIDKRTDMLLGLAKEIWPIYQE